MAETKHAVELTDDNFDQMVLKSDKPVLVDFWAAWCGPCQMIAPAIEELAKEFEGRAVVGKLDVDSHARASQQYRVTSIPTLLVFKNGQVVDKIIGAVAKPVLKSKLDAQLA